MSKLLSQYLQALPVGSRISSKVNLKLEGEDIVSINPSNNDTDEVPILDQAKVKGLNLVEKPRLRDWMILVLAAIFLCLPLYISYHLGKRSERRITWFSELFERTQGRKQYFMDFEVVCNNGKDIGRLQVDLNLTNGKLHVVRNDNQNEPNCVLDPAKK